MRLTAEQHAESIKRYRHIKPASGRGVLACATLCPGTSHNCTRPRGHSGPHVAHGRFRKLLAVWDSGTSLTTSSPGRPATRSGGVRKGRPLGLRSRPEGSLMEALGRGLVKAITNWDQLIFVVLFVVFVKFAIDVLMSLY